VHCSQYKGYYFHPYPVVNTFQAAVKSRCPCF